MNLWVMFESICAPLDDAKVIRGCRQYCPGSDHHFWAAAAEQMSIESVREQVKPLLEDRIVVGFAMKGDLQVLGITLPTETKRDIQLHFNAKWCSESDLVGRGLPELNSNRQVHSMKNLAHCVLGRSIQEGAHSALVDAQATMELYLWDRGRIERH